MKALESGGPGPLVDPVSPKEGPYWASAQKQNVRMFYTVSFDPEILLTYSMLVSTFGPRGGITFGKKQLK